MNYIGLDMCGVLGDSYISRILEIDCSLDFDFVEAKQYGINDFDLKGLDERAVLIFLKTLTSNDMLILVSSWISSRAEKATYLYLEKIFQQILPRSSPYFHGQLPTGNGGAGRERALFRYYVEHKLNGPLYAVDDSGKRHFPKLFENRCLIVPDGLNGFTPRDAVRLKFILGNFDSDYPESWFISLGYTAPESIVKNPEKFME
tara:strand:+ start:7033 stop:7641 length:609 start_codon:yes stop_codon:yes gene_type:complete